MSEPPPFDPRWMGMLRAAVVRHGSIQAVAEMLGYSRTLLSLVLSGKYDKSTTQLERQVLARLDMVDCPQLKTEIGRARCDGFHRRRMPQSDPEQLRHWNACRGCAVRAAALAVEAEQGRAAHV